MTILRRYGWLGLLRLAFDVVLTRLSWPRSRVMRRPLYIRGRHAISIGRGFTSGPGLRMDAFPVTEDVVLEVGDDVQINDHVHLAAIERLKIGNRVLIASRVFVSDHDHGNFEGVHPDCAPDVPPAIRPLSSRPVTIEDDVWIGEGVCVLAGVTIGKGSVIGAGSVVTRDIPAGCVAAGNPARILRRFDSVSGRWERVSS